LNIAVLSSAENWYARALLRAAKRGEQLSVLSFTELDAWVGPLRTDRGYGPSCDQRQEVASVPKAAEFDAVIVRAMPPGSLEQIVVRMDVLARLQDSGVTVVNPPKALEACIDKYLALSRLAAAGIAVPATYVCQTVVQAMQGFEMLGGDVVVKPSFGSEGRGIVRITDAEIALRVFKAIHAVGGVCYLQEYVPHEGDFRLLVVGERVWGIRRRNHGDWRTNLSRGAIAEKVQITPRLQELALQATRAVGAVIAGVDILPTTDGKWLVVEVNGVPGWKGIAKTHNIDVARAILDDCAARVHD